MGFIRSSVNIVSKIGESFVILFAEFAVNPDYVDTINVFIKDS